MAERPSYKIGPITIDGRAGQVFRDGTDLEISSTELDVLLMLANHAGKLVLRPDFPPWFRSVEAGIRHPVDDVISRLRQLLGDDIKIDHVWGRGYELTTPRLSISIQSGETMQETENLSSRSAWKWRWRWFEWLEFVSAFPGVVVGY